MGRAQTRLGLWGEPRGRGGPSWSWDGKVVEGQPQEQGLEALRTGQEGGARAAHRWMAGPSLQMGHKRVWREAELHSGSWNLLPHSQIFALIVFSSLLTDGYQNKTDSSQLRCVLNSNNMACSFAVGAGLLALLSCLAFLALDAHEGHIACTRFRTAFQLLDFILAGERGPLPLLAQGPQHCPPRPASHVEPKGLSLPSHAHCTCSSLPWELLL